MQNGTSPSPADKIEELAQEVPPETEELAAEVVSDDDLGEQGNDRAES